MVIIGYGSIGKRHCKNLSKFKDIQCFVVTNRKRINLPSKNFQKFNSLDECLKLHPDIGFITNVTSSHVDIATKLVKANCHVFIEKPLSNSMKGVKKLENLIHKKRLVSTIGCVMRFHPCLKKIKHLISEGEIGKILYVRMENGSYMPDWHRKENYRKSYASRKELGGGVVFTCIHEIDYLFWLFGSVRECYSITRKLSDLEINVDDLSSILLQFKNDVVAEIHLDYFQRPSFRSCKIVGTKGTIYWDSDSNSVKTYDINKKRWKSRLSIKKYNINNMYLNETTHFLDCVKTNKRTINDIKQGVQTLEIALAIQKSSKNKKAEIFR